MWRFASIITAIVFGTTSIVAQSSPQPRFVPSLDGGEFEIRERGQGQGWTMLPYEITRDAERLVRISSSDKKRYEQLRKSGRLKMVKIFSAPSCASKRYVVDVSNGDCVAGVDLIRTSFYSLSRGLYGESIADIRIIEGTLYVGNDGMQHGMVMDLGPVEPTKVDATTVESVSIYRFARATTLEDEAEIRNRLAEGVEVRGRRVSSSVALNQGHTYLVRTINYSFVGGSRNIFQQDSLYLIHFAELNKDRTALLLWKKLAERPAPRL
jgi:hypothetical protein